jgi:hypothetical protein
MPISKPTLWIIDGDFLGLSSASGGRKAIGDNRDVLESLFGSSFNHLMRLIARESFIENPS